MCGSVRRTREAGLVSAIRIHRPDLIGAAAAGYRVLIHDCIGPAAGFAPCRMLGIAREQCSRNRMDAGLGERRPGKKTDRKKPYWNVTALQEMSSARIRHHCRSRR